MSARYEIHASNDITAIHVATKCTLGAALLFANEILETWQDVYIRHYESEDAEQCRLVARLSQHGLIV